MPCSVELAHLAAAGLVWFLLHAAVAGSRLRFWLVGRFGEKAFRSAFSLASVAALWWLISAYRHAPYRRLWHVPEWLGYLPVLVMPLAFILLAGAYTVPSPTLAGGEKALLEANAARGVLRITRHPFLWSVVLWAGVHLLVNADVGSYLFFSSLGLTALVGSFDIDRKRRRTHAQAYARFEAVTSNVPFAALLTGRTRLSTRELWWQVALGLLLTLGVIALHPRILGVPAIPGVHG
jgi:uncharacterized membrane protein